MLCATRPIDYNIKRNQTTHLAPGPVGGPEDRDAHGVGLGHGEAEGGISLLIMLCLYFASVSEVREVVLVPQREHLHFHCSTALTARDR